VTVTASYSDRGCHPRVRSDLTKRKALAAFLCHSYFLHCEPNAKSGGYYKPSNLLRAHYFVIVIASAARQSIAARITSNSRNLDRRVAQALLAMTENNVSDYNEIRLGLQQIHIIVIASAARQSIAARITLSSSLRVQRGNPLRPTLPRHRHCERSAAIHCGPPYLVIVIASAARQSIAAHLTSSSQNLDRRVAQVLLAMTENNVGDYNGIFLGLQQIHIIVIASAARQSIADHLTSSSRNLDRRVAQALLAMTENKVGGCERIRSGLQQIHIIYVIASAARQSITDHLTSSSRNLDRRVAQVLLAMTENNLSGTPRDD